MAMSKKAKLWGGRFAKPTAKIVEDFTVSVQYEDRLVPYDIQGSLAQAEMLGRQGIISRAESAKLKAGLQRVLKEWQAGRFKLDPAYEDVHGNVEARLKAMLGPVAGKLHSGRSRNDQIALDLKLYLRDEAQALIKLTDAAIEGFLGLAEANPGLVMPGYTHLQRAQPIVFGHWCLAYVEMLFRDRRRLGFALGSLAECPLGAAALAGSPLPLDRAWTARELGFVRPTANSLDSVSDRDHLLDLASAMSILMAHLSRLGEEVVLYNSQEFGFFTLDDSFATGSSLMPQKKNPDVAELLRGRAGRAYGLLVHLLTLVKGQPLAYNRDMQEGQELLFQTLDLVKACLGVVPPLLNAISPNAEAMAAACKRGFLDATDAADYLVRQGVPFREAHEAVGRAIRLAQAKGCGLDGLSGAELKEAHPRFSTAMRPLLAPISSASARKTFGGPAPANVAKALRLARARLRRKDS
jgi:argininosuccinate lyase